MTDIFHNIVLENYTSTIQQTHLRGFSLGFFLEIIAKVYDPEQIKSYLITIIPTITMNESAKKPQVALAYLPQNPNNNLNDVQFKVRFYYIHILAFCANKNLKSFSIVNFTMTTVKRYIATTLILCNRQHARRSWLQFSNVKLSSRKI